MEASARISKALPNADSPIWSCGIGGPMPVEIRALNKRLAQVALAGITLRAAQGSFSVHGIGHTMITRRASFGVTLPRTQYWVGHRSAALTAEVYTYIESGDL